MTLLLLVRHAHAQWTADEDRPLSRRGRRDADRLARLLEGYNIGAIYSSPATRAVQTIEPLARRKSLAIRLDERLGERELGAWSASSFEDAVRRTWDDMDFAHRHGETNRQAQQRAMQAVDDILRGAAPHAVVISTHGNLLALIINHYVPTIGYSFWQSLSMPDVYCLYIAADGMAQVTRLWQETG